MRRTEKIPENSELLMDFAGTRISATLGNGKRFSFFKAIRSKEELEKFTIFSPAKDAVFRNSLHCNPMSEEWKATRKIYHEADRASLHPKMFDLRSKILEFGGEDVCFLGDDEDMDKILAYGQFWFGRNARMKKGRPSRCHANAATLWSQNRENTRICTGYALSEDGMWRQHSWLLHIKDRSNQIIETTVPRIGYFGFCMTTEQCKKFAMNNW